MMRRSGMIPGGAGGVPSGGDGDAGVGTIGTSRTEAYTDGVFAIAATLLVLDLSADALGRVQSDPQMWQQLAGMGDKLLAFAISFALLSMLWTIHLRQFADIARVDTTLLWLNNARLLFIVLMPFTTSLTSEYSDWYAGRMLMPIDFFFAALLGHLSWRWAAARGGHLMRERDAVDWRYRGAGGMAAVICAAIAMAVSPWAGSFGFLSFLLLNAPLTRLLQARAASRAPGSLKR